MIKRSIKLILLTTIVCGLAGIFSYTWLYHQNNKTADFPDKSQLSNALDRSVDWLKNHENEILDVYNPVLWYRVKRTAELTNNLTLLQLYQKYIDNTFELSSLYQKRLWSPLFDKSKKVYIYDDETDSLPDYIRHWAYALHCSENLLNIPVIAEQNSYSFCGDLYLAKPTCTSHQMSGLLFLKRNDCGDTHLIDTSINVLKHRLANLLTYDIRLVDIYFQRVLKLVESGGSDLVKPIWIHRLLNAQQADGGWANFEPFFHVGNDRYIGFGHADSRTGKPRGDFILKGVSVGEVHSTFHATMQSVMLLGLLIHNEAHM